MKKLIKKMPPKAVTAILVAAGLLLLSGSVGGTRAALIYRSDVYSSRVQLRNIGVTLLEQGETDYIENSDGTAEDSWREISRRDYLQDGSWEEEKGELLTTMLPKDKDGNPTEGLKIGKKYTERLKVENSGEIGEFVRVSIYKYWVDEKDDEKDDENTENTEKRNRTLDPDVIKLEFANQDVWVEDETAGTEERTVLYYKNMLHPGEETLPFTEAIWIDQSIVYLVTEEISETLSPDGTEKYTTKKSTYDYDGKRFCHEVEVDAVQEHNAEDAVLSAWGRNVAVSAEYNDDGETITKTLELAAE